MGKGLNKYPPVEWSSIWGPLHCPGCPPWTRIFCNLLLTSSVNSSFTSVSLIENSSGWKLACKHLTTLVPPSTFGTELPLPFQKLKVPAHQEKKNFRRPPPP